MNRVSDTTWFWSFQKNKPASTEDRDIGVRMRLAGRGFDSDEQCDIAHYNDLLNETARRVRLKAKPQKDADIAAAAAKKKELIRKRDIRLAKAGVLLPLDAAGSVK